MGLVAAKCPNCGANIEVDNSLEAGICKYCGTPFVTEKAINNYTNIYNTNIAQATIINQERKKEFRSVKVCSLPHSWFDGSIEVFIDGVVCARMDSYDEIEIKIDVNTEHRIECALHSQKNTVKSNVLFVDNYTDFCGIFIDYPVYGDGYIEISALSENDYKEYEKEYSSVSISNLKKQKNIKAFNVTNIIIGISLIIAGIASIIYTINQLDSGSGMQNIFLFVIGIAMIIAAIQCLKKRMKTSAIICIIVGFIYLSTGIAIGNLFIILVSAAMTIIGVALIVLNILITKTEDSIE